MSADHTAAENAVVIIRPFDVPWLRELQLMLTGPTARPRLGTVVIYAYSTTKRTRRPESLHYRRAWVRKPGDHAAYGDADWPREAVDPRSIAPGVPSRRMGPR